LHVDHGFSVPNVALGHDGDGASVDVLVDGKVQQRRLKLGTRGATRTQVLEGLRPGDRVLLAATKATEAK
jgi:multidrug efflux pump subunit AcrA (membrane-fusion protein)